MTEQSR